MSEGHITCSKCGVAFCIPASYERSRRKDHKEFWCPNGHSQYFPGKTEEEKKIERLKRQLHDSWDRVSGMLDEHQAMKRALKTCVLCGWHVPRLSNPDRVHAALRDHYLAAHGASEEARYHLELPAGDVKELNP